MVKVGDVNVSHHVESCNVVVCLHEARNGQVAPKVRCRVRGVREEDLVEDKDVRLGWILWVEWVDLAIHDGFRSNGCSFHELTVQHIKLLVFVKSVLEIFDWQLLDALELLVPISCHFWVSTIERVSRIHDTFRV